MPTCSRRSHWAGLFQIPDDNLALNIRAVSWFPVSRSYLLRAVRAPCGQAPTAPWEREREKQRSSDGARRPIARENEGIVSGFRPLPPRRLQIEGVVQGTPLSCFQQVGRLIQPQAC